MDRHFLHGNREIPFLALVLGIQGPQSEPQGGTRLMHENGKSDTPIVPEKQANKEGSALPLAESVEGRGVAKGNLKQQNKSRAQTRQDLQSALDGIRQVARRSKEEKLKTLWHHVYNIDRLRESYFATKRNSAAGIDDVTWQSYGEDLEVKLQDLSARLKCGAYRAKPVRRQYIPKTDGRRRPIGIPVLEDKIVQGATAEVMNTIYEIDFKGFSYGFRPSRSQHNALDAVSVGIYRKKVSWVLDADIVGFFDALSHDLLIKFIEHRISDERLLRHIKKWLNAGVMDAGKVTRTSEGTPQGGSISPLLANIYLHYVFDLWADQWRDVSATGDVIIVRYADDFIVGFQHEHEAKGFLRDLKERLARFGLELHPKKTRLIRFGRFAAQNRRALGLGSPDTFDFLGFTHYCGKAKNGYFNVGRSTIRSRLRAKVKAVSLELRKRMHDGIVATGSWLRTVLLGHYRYFGVPENHYSMRLFRDEITRRWRHVLRRRSHKTRLNWSRFSRIVKHWLPWPQIYHLYPSQRLDVITRGRSPVR